jgi:MoxR-like ATPase
MATLKFEGGRFDPDVRAVPASGGYVYHDPRIVLAVNVALETRRPLFVTGSPGTGKSSLAGAVAQELSWAYVATTVTSRTRLDDLVARYDAVQRLNDAQDKAVKPPSEYLVPGVLWWAFAPESAAAQALATDRRRGRENATDGIVVLLDEIDKAEPDLPNDLLAPLDRYEVDLAGLGVREAATAVLVVVTSNGERAMPPAFLRRCVVLELDDEDPDFFVGVAISHFGERADTLYADVATRTRQLSGAALNERRRRPSMAEYLDTVRVCLAYGERPPTSSTPGTALWEAIEETALRKSRVRPESSPDG